MTLETGSGQQLGTEPLADLDVYKRQEPQREEPQHRNDDNGEQPRNNGWEHRAQIEVLQMSNVLGQQTQHVARAMCAPEEDGVALDGCVEL